MIGDLATVKEAKEFVQSRMCCGDAPSSFFDMTEDGNQIDMWPRVYKVCGGNIGLLELCASSAKDLGSWEEGIDVVTELAEEGVKSGFKPENFTGKQCRRSPAAWTKEEYKTVLMEIALAKEYKHVVSLEKLEEKVGSRSIRSMVEWNLVTVRVKSSWARDLPSTFFNELGDMRLVTMPSPVDLYFVLKMHDAGELNASSKGKI